MRDARDEVEYFAHRRTFSEKIAGRERFLHFGSQNNIINLDLIIFAMCFLFVAMCIFIKNSFCQST
jgi:hypothetical protein